MLNHKRNMALIHVARRDLGLDEDDYRQVIRSIGGAVSGSARDLTPAGVEQVLAHFRRLGWLPAPVASDKLTALGRNRSRKMASAPQLAMLLSIWKDASRAKTEDAFNTFLYRRFGVSHYRFLPRDKVQGVKLALEKMRQYSREVA